MALSDIYGIDKNDMASRIASDALGAPNPDAYSGAPKGGVGAKGNSPVEDDMDATIFSIKGDSRAKTAGNHGEQS